MASGLVVERSPSFRLVGAHFGLGVAGLCAFGAALLAAASQLEGYFFQPVLLGLVHLCVLGWLLPIALGALYQFVPVVFDVPVRSERLAWGALVLYGLGTFGLVGHLWTMSTGWGLAVSAVLLCASLWLYALQLLATLARTREWTLTGVHIAAALGYLLLAATLGLALAWNLFSPWLPLSHLQLLRAHAHAAGLGFFGLLIMGVAYRLLEMFLLGQGAPQHSGWVAFVSVNAALVLLLAGFVLGSRPALIGAGAGLAAVGILAFLNQVRLIHRARLRRRVDTTWRLTFASCCYLVAALVLGGTLVAAPLQASLRDRLVLAYGLLALPGFMGSIVIGQLYKILPFLVWMNRFSPHVGFKKVPHMDELLAERPQRVQSVLMHGGLLALAAGILVGSPALRLVGAAIFAASCALAARNLWTVSRSRL
jgi:hypothetical protein